MCESPIWRPRCGGGGQICHTSRIRELEPDCADPWLAAQQIAKKRSLPGIEAGYRGVMLLKGDVDRDGHYDSAVGRASYEAAEVLLYILSNEQVGDA